MSLSEYENFSVKEKETFTSVCNQLLGRTFLIRTVRQPDGSVKNNPEYSFLTRNTDIVRSYLSILGWELHQDEYNGFFYVLNNLDANRLTLSVRETAILLTLRLIYDENSEKAGLFQDVICDVQELLEKLITDFGIFRPKPNMDEFKRNMKRVEEHVIIQRISGKYSDSDCRFAILPTILTVVSAERLNALVANLRRNEDTAENADDIDDLLGQISMDDDLEGETE